MGSAKSASRTPNPNTAEANLPSRVVADQLGHANEATSRRFYVAPVANAAAVPVLETLEPTPPEPVEQKE